MQSNHYAFFVLSDVVMLGLSRPNVDMTLDQARQMWSDLGHAIQAAQHNADVIRRHTQKVDTVSHLERCLNL